MERLVFIVLFVVFALVSLSCTNVSSSKLSLDPDDTRNFSQIVWAKGYPCEEHKVVTPDGYILTMFRIPYGRQEQSNGKVVLLQHGLLDSSFTWIINEPYESLSYILADQGYDVWMGNNRGTTYGTAHVNLSTRSKEFWQFSWDQLAAIDFPSLIDYALDYTNQSQLAYVGHSEGTLIAFAHLSESPEYVEKISSFVGLGPLVTVGHITNEFLRLLADFDLEVVFELFGNKAFLPSEKLLNQIFPYFCHETPAICGDVIELLCGKHKKAFNNSRMEVMSAHEPGGTSVQNIAHFAQNIVSDTFQKFDYGSKRKNKEHYGTDKPPMYNISNFPSDRLPLALFYGTADELSDPADVAYLIGHLPSPPEIALELNGYAHLDYVWDIEAYQDLYPILSNFIQKNFGM